MSQPPSKRPSQQSMLHFITKKPRNEPGVSRCEGPAVQGPELESSASSASTDFCHEAQASELVDPMDPANFSASLRNQEYMLRFLGEEAKFRPSESFHFPVRNGRKYNKAWEKDRPWLRYSLKNDSAFCAYCLCFGNLEVQSPFANQGFKNWKKAVGNKDSYLDKHSNSADHIRASQKARNFLYCVQNPGKDINARLSKQESDAQVRVKRGILSIIDIVLSLGQRGIAFRGNWKTEEKKEDGNFSFFVDWKSKYDHELAEHITHASKAGKYTSPQIQNEIIQMCEQDVRSKVVTSIPEYWSLLADETQDCATCEQISICVRYVKNNEVREDFLGFVQTDKMDAESISKKLISTLKAWHLDMNGLVGQGYDGAAVMSSEKNGVQAKIKEKYTNATYVHCRSHVLALALAASCKSVSQMRNLFDNIEKLTWFLGASAKRKEIFLDVDKEISKDASKEDYVTELLHNNEENTEAEFESSDDAILQGSKRKMVPKFCSTRWTARVYTLSALLAKYPSVLAALERIENESSGDAARDASAYVRMMSDGQFVVCLYVAQFVLSYCSAVTSTLQAVRCDLAKAYRDVQLSKLAIGNARSEERWDKLWARIQFMAEANDITITKPRTTWAQRHRANAATEDYQTQSAKDYFRINVFYVFIDHVVAELDERFDTSKHTGLIAAYALVPSNLASLQPQNILDIATYYGKFLKKEELQNFEAEVEKWQVLYKDMPCEIRPNDAATALSACDHEYFPAIRRILTIFLTIPVGSVACERSFSALRRLKLWTRASMAEDRLSGLALLLVHRNSDLIPTPERIYSKKSNWRVFLK